MSHCLIERRTSLWQTTESTHTAQSQAETINVHGMLDTETSSYSADCYPVWSQSLC
ncbi:hypothetical protein LR48_Vigan406s008800 [Vigna angularis]|uniref:Uncharacterized protein n=1 Tax=Phaseolus angularis TaxID=3914 RepID=A0A0L9T9M0_PHAAN|nr:hypothetical protein LR48_Vigan406s008800 [Vigna angularis]